ncbi:Asr1405/Asl0597 family protein [Calothrix sp. NIES-3974]|uniref:Asr1405/Asl0597 family protein n=1 Tax=Calothrix sp. NIES-3974 TaxID=2005462 RepID=UPI000B5F1313|nr:Asr1405/Asl0597 family protein [Calothrix sp. NIES-3974]BAZ07522.1 hypothetical protein NIES3974_41860 [Calothrix sp. NIES-3974]
MDLEEQQNVVGGIRDAIALQDSDRWEVYRRLQDLNIKCWCSSHQPLRVEVESIREVVQVWCMVRLVVGSRSELIARLERCWQIQAD